MFVLFFNEKTQVFTIAPFGGELNLIDYGSPIKRHEQRDILRGIALGLSYARFCTHPFYDLDSISKAVHTNCCIIER